MWSKGWRDLLWSDLDRKWDILVIGGGITGAGILREAVRAGFKTLLVEARDFASGTSSRSSKLVHGGFRYLQNAQLRMTYESVRERERLLKEGRGLINPLGFLFTSYEHDRHPSWLIGLGLTFYDLLGLKWGHRHYPKEGILERAPLLEAEGLRGGYRYFDAQTDDARLVLRVIREAVKDGGAALNYARADGLLTTAAGKVSGVVLRDQDPDGRGRETEVQAGVVINATGAWADELRCGVCDGPSLRRLRGSHLVFPSSRLPLTRAISMQHPDDRRYVFALPWEGVTLIGTTDVDHEPPMECEPVISPQEIEYLLHFARRAFPDQNLEPEDIQATFAGVRPVVGTGKADPSKESREHVLWCENGLITVTGGKLTTFRLMAHDALRVAGQMLSGKPEFNKENRCLDPPPVKAIFQAACELSPALRLRLSGRYGSEAPEVISAAGENELTTIRGTQALWAELRWAARSEGVIHLEDLLLRRLRLGLLLPHGGLDDLQEIREIAQPELGWDDARWMREARLYTELWQQCYHIPVRSQL